MNRFIRQETFIGKEAQKKINSSKVCIVGIGALGTLAAELLTRAGIKELILIDNDKIELDNLQRQHLFTEKDVGKSKAKIAKRKLNKINSKTIIKTHDIRLNENNISTINSDLVLDCTDNLETSYIISDYCKNKMPLVFGSAIRNEGYVYVMMNKRPDIRKIFNNVKTFEKCTTQGVMNTITSLISSIQVNEAIKVLTNKKHEKDLLKFNLKNNEIIKINV